jgi:hypothetical protein
VPIFTRPDIMRAALLRNPDWRTVNPIEVSGGDLLDTRDPDVAFVIDPWSPLEFQLPPPERSQRGSGSTTTFIGRSQIERTNGFLGRSGHASEARHRPRASLSQSLLSPRRSAR